MSNSELFYFIFCGTLPYAVINSIWASLDINDIKPTNVILLVTKNQYGIKKIKRCVETLVEEFLSNNCKVELLSIAQTDIKFNIEKLDEHVKTLKKNSKVIIDITPGRKTMSISGLLFVHKEIREKNIPVFYDSLIYWQLTESGKYSRKWYPEIPRKNFEYIDLMEVIQ